MLSRNNYIKYVADTGSKMNSSKQFGHKSWSEFTNVPAEISININMLQKNTRASASKFLKNGRERSGIQR